MSKYQILETWALRGFLERNPDIYSPEGNRLTVVSNGIMGGQLLYDRKAKKVYGLCLKEATDATAEYLEQCKGPGQRLLHPPRLARR